MSVGAVLMAAWLSAAVLAGEPVDAADVSRDVQTILAQERYYFCAADNEYEPSVADLRWCVLAAADNFQRCPGYAEVCARSQEGEPGSFAGAPGDTSPAQQQPGKANQNAFDDAGSFLQLPDLGGFARVLMWLLLIGGVLAVAVLLAKNLVRDRAQDDREIEPDPDAGESLIAARAAALRVVETDVARLLARAEQAAAGGDHEAAINDVYAALLRRLEGEQLITVDRWKTNGDYVNALRPRPPLRDELREIIREVEQVQFGAAAAERGRYQLVRAKVIAIVSRASLGLALLLGAGTQLGCPLFSEEQPGSSALAGLRSGPTGKRAVGDLLLANGIKARHRTGTITQLAQTSGAIVLLDSVTLHDDDWDALTIWVEEQGGTLLISTGQPFPTSFGIDYASETSDRTGLASGGDDFDELELVAPPGRVLELRVGALGRTTELLGREPEFQPDPVDELGLDFQNYPSAEPYVVQRPLGAGQIVVFAEPDLLSNAGISVADNATFVVKLVRSLDVDSVEFINHYQGADDPFEAVSNAKLGAFFVQVLLFLALLYAAVGLPFARLRDPALQRRRSFSEHVQTLGQRYAQARAARYVAGIYSAYVLDRLRERLQPGAARSLHPLAVAIAARTGRHEGQVMQLLVTAHDLRDTSDSSTRGGPSNLELMRQLAQLLDETGGAR